MASQGHGGPGGSVWRDHGRRAVDLGGAVVLIGLCAPIMAFIAVTLLCQDGRPVLVGRMEPECPDGLHRSLKFRTTVGDPPVISGFGQWLERRALDQLPQLFNVARGDVSFWREARPGC